MKIALMSDFDVRGSGYFNISCSLATELVKRGHEIKAVGLGYNGEEHNFPFGIIPCRDIRESFAIIVNLKNMWQFDVFLCALDIPLQEQYVNFNIQNGSPMKYVGIMPIEADPLCISWALVLMQMNKALIISEFGTEEARKGGVDATYLPVGIDINAWRVSTPEERESLRKALGFKDDEFVILTVAYNQERKFLSRSLEIFASFIYDMSIDEIKEQIKLGNKLEPKVNTKYVMVTSEQSPVGWKLRDMAQEFGISDRIVIFERGMEFQKLWGIYAASDAFLLTSKAEGLGMPLMEAMAMGIPAAGTDCTGIHELLENNRGYLIPYDYTIRDPFGNGRRYYASIKDGVTALKYMYDFRGIRTDGAKEYVRSRTWEHSTDILERALKDIVEQTPKDAEDVKKE